MKVSTISGMLYVLRSHNAKKETNIRMRGYDDFAMELPKEEAIRVIKDVVQAQRKILSDVITDKDLTEIPQMWCIYKEVQEYFEDGLDVPDDVTLLWCDDNWGNIRRLPLDSERERTGGAGLYYHFDYVGDPRDYKWMNNNSLQRIWEQLHLAYQRGADRVWIVNVGDIKPQELPMSLYFDLAYDMDRWSYENLSAWVLEWATREFGDEHGESIAEIADTYSRYASRRKYELIDPSVFSLVNYREAERVLSEWAELERRAETVYQKLEEPSKPSFVQLILHPIKAAFTVYRIHINAGRNNLFAEQKRSTTNKVAHKVLDDFKRDGQLTAEYHALLGGKWNHMMEQTHLGYNYWQQPMRDALPPLVFVQESEATKGKVAFGVEGSYASVPGDDRFHELNGKVLALPPLSPFGPGSRFVDIFARYSGSSLQFWKLVPKDRYIKVEPPTGKVSGEDAEDCRVEISVDWSSVPTGVELESSVCFQVANTEDELQSLRYDETGHLITVPVHNPVIPITFKQGFVESDGFISIEAEHYTRSTKHENASYITIKGMGHTLSGVTLWPTSLPTQDPLTGSPLLEYSLLSFSPADPLKITVYCSPSLNFSGKDRPLKYAIALDDGELQYVSIAPTEEKQLVPRDWEQGVADDMWKRSTLHTVVPGEHVLKLWAIEPGVVFQKIVLDFGGERPSYLGPPESYFHKHH